MKKIVFFYHGAFSYIYFYFLFFFFFFLDFLGSFRMSLALITIYTVWCRWTSKQTAYRVDAVSPSNSDARDSLTASMGVLSFRRFAAIHQPTRRDQSVRRSQRGQQNSSCLTSSLLVLESQTVRAASKSRRVGSPSLLDARWSGRHARHPETREFLLKQRILTAWDSSYFSPFFF